VHTQSQSNARGSAGSFSSSTGAQGAGVRGAGGNSSGAVKTSGGDVYAGADGNVYKKTDNGWQKYDDGSWNPVQKPTQRTPDQARTTGQGNLSGATAGAAAGGAGVAGAAGDRAQRFERPAQLDQDHQARFGGAQRQQQAGAARQGGFGGRSRR
jgi:hypothetical protein